VAEVQSDPVRLNSNLGRYNNFMNLLDLCGLTLPAGRYTFGPGFGITLIAPAWHDRTLLALGARYLGEPAPDRPLCNLISDKPAGTKTSVIPSSSDPLSFPVPASSAQEVTLAVCGAHLRGQPLHHQLTALGARFLAATTTAPVYRLYALANTTPPKPGLARTAVGTPGASISVETYSLSPEAFGRFVSGVPAPMVIGTVELLDGGSVKGFLCEPCALMGATDITTFGGWVAFLASR
jgi:allophanate hydrolase